MLGAAGRHQREKWTSGFRMTKSIQMTRACRRSWVRSRGAERWTECVEERLSIQDMEGVGTIEEDTAAEEPETGAAATREEAETAVQVAAAEKDC